MKKIVKSAYDKVPFKRELFSALKLFYRPRQSLYQHLHFKGIFDVWIEGKSFKMRHYGNVLENYIFWEGLFGGWEAGSLAVWARLAKNAKCIMDIGANTGIYALIAKTVNPDARVYAFEPVKRVYDKLKTNCVLNKYDIVCEELAVSSYDGRGVIYDQKTDHTYSVTLNQNTAGSDTEVMETEIQAAKLSTYIQRNGITAVDLMKIDVETHEVEVLKGMGDYLSRKRPAMLVEIARDFVAQGIEEILKGKNYLFFKMGEGDNPVQTEQIINCGLCNYLICQKETAFDLGLING